MYEYADCYYCKGNVEDRYISREVIKPQTAKRIDVLLREQSEQRKTMQVPVYEYAT